MTTVSRDAVWREIWRRKGLDVSLPLHHADGFDLLTEAEMHRMIAEVTAPIGLRGDERILECGCGAGAFLAGLLALHPRLHLSGVDYSPTLLERAREGFDGEFFLADMTDLSFLASNTYDHTLSFGAVIYLASEDAARRAVAEMLRVTRPGGTVYVGEVSDAAKRADAESIRRSSHDGVARTSDANPDHLYVPKSLFEDLARAHGADLRIVDHTAFDLGGYQAARYRYSVYLRKPDGPPA